ncbi:TadE/TadG family type IV pilus assembly protein [uncultured Cohaesibacter sp.]|uniref:TadE/TadG family type IV pilus assembly protein n=1 Tax=uncultured Cohaesibacter sp. TaxID=1002546 RepID=UPI0029C82AB4|nr:TadE/TadG family type IV pilus assembly protein [uncultured Cohaesibacter sp.]
MTFLSTLHSLLNRLRKDERGVVSVEFALVLPLMAVLLLGSWELNGAVLTKRKSSHLASALANLAAQDDNITASDWATFGDIADRMMFPYDGFTRRIGLIGVEVDSAGRVNLVCSFGDAAIDPASLPDGLKIANSFYLMSASEVDYEAFTKNSSFYGTSSGFMDMTFRDTAIFAPRNSDEVTCN